MAAILGDVSGEFRIIMSQKRLSRPKRGRAIYDGAERRKKPRICLPFFAKVRGLDTEGKTFVVSATVDNISAGGIYLQLPVRVSRGERLLTITRLCISQTTRGLHVAARGLVVRVDPKPHEMYGVAVSFTRYRCL